MHHGGDKAGWLIIYQTSSATSTHFCTVSMAIKRELFIDNVSTEEVYLVFGTTLVPL